MTVGALSIFSPLLISMSVLVIAFGTAGAVGRAAELKVPVTFSGGHEIGKNDYGRPVVLIAAALGVKPEVFREAFGGVTPARGRGPSRAEAQKNKAALMKVLAPQGVTNDRLDEVSDYYRFRPERGEIWPTTDAQAHAIVKNGQVQRIVVTEPGSGYCSPPEVTVQDYPNLRASATLKFSKDLTRNGGIAAVELVPAKRKKAARSAP